MFKWPRFAYKTISLIKEVGKYNNPNQAREKSRLLSKDFYENFCPKFWINVEIKFSQKTREQYPEIVEAIENYTKTWELSKILPLLWLWNHQAFGIEAFWAYNIFPSNWRIVLKNELAENFFLQKWIQAIDPIVLHRWESWAWEVRNSNIINTISDNNPVLVYPEGTRSKDWEIRWFNYKNYQAWYNIITDSQNEISSKVAIITADTMKVLPQTLEKTLLWMWNVNPWTITYTIDIVDASLYDNIQEFNNDVKNILVSNLQKEKS